MKIDLLIVDASPALRRMMHRALRMGSLNVGHIHEASDADETRQILDEHWVDAIIASWHIWFSEEVRLVQWLKSDEVMHEIPTLVTSADGREHTLNQIADYDPSGLLIKPFQPETLYMEVNKVKTYEIE